MILCIGEILADMIGVKSADGGVGYERKAGGAPFNVACAAKRFGAKVGFYGCVGDDIIGDYLAGFAATRAFDAGRIERAKDRNTTLAFVELDASGERSFCFYRKNTADILLPELTDEEIQAADIVHIGSLMLSEKSGMEYALRIADRAHAFGKKVSFDVNFRTDIFKNVSSAVKAYKSVLEKADIVKFSEDEVEVFSAGYVDGLRDKVVCVTLGEKGSEWRYGGKNGVIPTVKIKSVDTTGAGDAFYAGVLTRLDAARCKYTKEILDGALKFGNACGALNTLGRGAIDALPDRTAAERIAADL